MTFYETLITAGLPVISADETGKCVMGKTTPEQDELLHTLTVQYFQPIDYQNKLDNDLLKQQIKSEFITTVDTLLQIENATSPTNAQIVAAVKFLARTLRLLLKFIARMVA